MVLIPAPIKVTWCVCYGRAITECKFTRKEMVCVKTLYNYADADLIGR